MNIRTLALIPMAALLLAGCGKTESGAPAASTAPATSGPREIDISAADTMKYDVAEIDAKPGEDLKVVLTNVGNVPKEQMAHNWVLLNTSSDDAAKAFDLAGLNEKANGYIPQSPAVEILAKIPLVGPHQSSDVEFKAPATPGSYEYLCTFPAHFQVGMHGVLVVK